MFKAAALVFLLAAAAVLVVGQNVATGRSQHPPSDFRLRVNGYVTDHDGRRVATLQGVTEKISLDNFDAVLCHDLLQVKPIQDEQQSRTARGTRSQTAAIWEINGFEKPNSLDLFMIPSRDVRDLGKCFYASIGAAENFQTGRWEQTGRNCGPKQDGTIWTRRKSFSDTTTNQQMERIEAICQNKDGILWLEWSDRVNRNPIMSVHLDVVDSGDMPQLDRMNAASFALPALCVVNPQQVDSPSQLFSEVFQALGVSGTQSIGANVGFGRGAGRRFGGENRMTGREDSRMQNVPHRSGDMRDQEREQEQEQGADRPRGRSEM